MAQKTLLFRLVICSLTTVCWMIDKKIPDKQTERMKEGRKEKAFNPCYFCLGGISRNDRKKRWKKNPFVLSRRSCLRNFSRHWARRAASHSVMMRKVWSVHCAGVLTAAYAVTQGLGNLDGSDLELTFEIMIRSDIRQDR